MGSSSGEDIFHVLTNTCLDVINSKLKPSDGFDVVLAKCIENEETSSVLIDVLTACEGDVNHAQNKEQAKSNWISFTSLMIDTVLPDEVLRAELEYYDAANKEFRQQLIRLKTRIYFKQAKFNLLREESEGYSKLITELIEAENVSNPCHSTIVKNRILALIGQFNLDPNRVTDIILECFENCPRQQKFFIDLLRQMDVVREYLCAILGFKYTFYQSVNKRTPFSLYVVTASLIQHGLLDLMKILAYMVPKTEEIKEGHRARAANAQQRASKAETISTASMPMESSLSRVLDETGPSLPTQVQTISFTTVATVQETDDQKLAEGFTEELVLTTNQKLGVACALLEGGSWQHAQPLLDRLPEYYAVQASSRLCRALCKIIERSMDNFYDTNCSRNVFGTAKKDRREEMESGLKQVTSWTDLAELSSVLWYLGPRIAYRPTTNIKLLRLITRYFQLEQKGEVEKDEKMIQTFVDVVAECILPSLTLSETNVALSEEIWGLLQLFPYSWRYWLYARWGQETLRHPEVNIARGKIYGRTKYVLKRLSKETVKIMGRQLGKLCHVHPMTVLSYLLSQVQTFDNLIGPVVEGLRFLSNLEFDVLAYCIISQLADPSKHALKASDGTLSPWLQALGTLVGALYRRYTIELHGMLDYVTNQLKCCKSFDLLLLREIIQNMSSIESSTIATQEQIEAMSGGETLRNEAGGYSNTRNKRASQRLRDALLNGDIAVGLCIQIAQQKDHVAYVESENLPLKLVGEMVDQSTDTLQQLGSFLVSYVKADEYVRRMPACRSLLTEYHLRLDSAMYLSRPGFMPKVLDVYEASKKQLKSAATSEDGQKAKLDGAQKQVAFKSALDSKIEEVMNGIKESIPGVSAKIPPKLLTVFWMLSLYDIEVPTGAYERAIENVKKQAKDYYDDGSSKTMRRGEDRIRQLESKLRDEQRRQTEHVERVRTWMAVDKDSLFEEMSKAPNDGFMQTCILPRAMFSEIDAVYCGKFFILLHQLGTTFFPSVLILNKTFEDVLPLISGLTENEANSLSRYLEILLTQVQKWHADKELFDKECAGFPGFVTTKVQVDHEYFRHLAHKWQERLTKSFTSVLKREESEYVLVRNCLILMTKISTCFPLVTSHMTAMETQVTKLRDREKGKRDDLALKAASYLGRLKKRNVKTYAVYEFHKVKKPVVSKKEEAATKTKTVVKKVTKPVEVKEKDETDGEPVEKKAKLGLQPGLRREVAKTEESESKEVKREKVSKDKESSNGTVASEENARKKKTETANGEMEKMESVGKSSSDEKAVEKKKKPDLEPFTASRRRPMEKTTPKREAAVEEGEVSPSPPPVKKIRATLGRDDPRSKKDVVSAASKESKDVVDKVVDSTRSSERSSTEHENVKEEKKGKDREKEREKRKQDERTKSKEKEKEKEKERRPISERVTKKSDDSSKDVVEKSAEKSKERRRIVMKDEEKEVAGPALPESMRRSSSKERDHEKSKKNTAENGNGSVSSSKSKKEKEKRDDRKEKKHEDISRLSKIADPVPRNRDRADRGRDFDRSRHSNR